VIKVKATAVVYDLQSRFALRSDAQLDA
jgi:hypothetical protein